MLVGLTTAESREKIWQVNALKAPPPVIKAAARSKALFIFVDPILCGVLCWFLFCGVVLTVLSI